MRGAICPRCDGSGTTMQSRTIEVTIPAGVTNGQRIRVKGQGGPGTSGGPAGDVFLVVTVLPDPRFEIEGANLRTTIDVPVLDAILGGEATVPTPTGRVALTIPGGNAKRPGLPPPRSGHAQVEARVNAGDLLATVNVILPTASAPRGTGLYQQLRDLHGGSLDRPLGYSSQAHGPIEYRDSGVRRHSAVSREDRDARHDHHGRTMGR